MNPPIQPPASPPVTPMPMSLSGVQRAPAVEPQPVRRLVYGLLITVAAGLGLGRICSTQLVYEPALYRGDDVQRACATALLPLAGDQPVGAAVLVELTRSEWQPPRANQPTRIWPTRRPEPMPTFSSNDRSRWATVRSLVDHGTFIIGYRDNDPLPRMPGSPAYRDNGIVFQDGYGTVDKVLKPEQIDGTQHFFSSKPPLLSVLVAGEYVAMKRLLGWSISEEPWYVVRTALLTFNWLPFLLYLAVFARLTERFGTTDWGRLYVLAAAAFATFVSTFLVTLNNHTLATCTGLFAFAAALPLLDGRQTHSAGRIFAVGLLAGFTVCMELPAASLAAALGVLLLWRSPVRTLLLFVPALLLPLAVQTGINYLALGKWTPAYAEFGGPWYQYPGSHWMPKPGKTGIDFADEPKTVYALHLLLGHHGLFSLTPVFFLSLVGMLGWLVRRQSNTPSAWPTLTFAGWRVSVVMGLTLALSVVVVGFYIFKSNNYGGWTSGPRWLMWLSPFLLLAALPVADRLGRWKSGRGLAYVLLALSVLSVSYPAWNPWRHPWIYNLFETNNWVSY